MLNLKQLLDHLDRMRAENVELTDPRYQASGQDAERQDCTPRGQVFPHQ